MKDALKLLQDYNRKRPFVKYTEIAFLVLAALSVTMQGILVWMSFSSTTDTRLAAIILAHVGASERLKDH